MYCRKCGERLSDSDLFCGKCGTPVQGTDVPYLQTPRLNATLQVKKITLVIVISVITVLLTAGTLLLMTMLFSSSSASSSLKGKYEYDNGRAYYTVDFKSNGSCIFTDDTQGYTHSRSGTYEYTDGEYILEFKFDDLYLPTTYSATVDGDILYIREIAGVGPLESGKFEKV